MMPHLSVIDTKPVLGTAGPNLKFDGGAPTLHSKMYGVGIS